MAKTIKPPPAADRTVDMFTGKTKVEAVSAAVEAVQDTEKGERVSMEADADRMREQAFRVQEWSTKNFGRPEAEGNTYRLTRSGEHYYLEILSKRPGGKEAYAYHGNMFHERDLFAIANVFVEAAKAKKAGG